MYTLGRLETVIQVGNFVMYVKSIAVKSETEEARIGLHDLILAEMNDIFEVCNNDDVLENIWNGVIENIFNKRMINMTGFFKTSDIPCQNEFVIIRQDEFLNKFGGFLYGESIQRILEKTEPLYVSRDARKYCEVI